MEADAELGRRLAALDRAKVHLRETIAGGKPGCSVAVFLQTGGEGDALDGRAYFRSEPAPGGVHG